MSPGPASLLAPLLLLAGAARAQAPAAPPRPPYPWPHEGREALAERLVPPPGFRRTEVAEGSFAAWLRGLPLRPAGAPVHLWDGRLKAYQGAQAAVLDLDVGRADLQQCADAVIRLRAEYLRAAGRDADLCFRATSGDVLPWPRWAAGDRAAVRGRKVTWWRAAAPDDGWPAFRQYLDLVFTYAGTASLARELAPATQVEIGDALVDPGHPGHAVLVVDAAEDGRGQRKVLLAQGYMPAQDVHVLLNPAAGDAWYPAPLAEPLVTPEWTFKKTAPRRWVEHPRCR